MSWIRLLVAVLISVLVVLFGIGMDAKTLKPVNTTDLASRAKYAAINTATKTAADVAIQNKSFANAFADNIRSNAATQLQATGASHLGHAYLNQDLSYPEHKLAHGALGLASGAITSTPMEGAVGGLVGEVTAEALVKARATDLLDQMLERKITPEQLQTGLAKLRQDASDIAKLTGATTAFVSGLDINATTTSAGNAAENNAVTPLDAAFIGLDLAKIGAAYYKDDQALMEEALKDLAMDIIPGVPAGTSHIGRLLASGAKGAYKADKLKDVTPKVTGEMPALPGKTTNELEVAKDSGGKRPTSKESEKYVEQQSGTSSRPQISFKDGVEVQYGTPGSVRPDTCLGNVCAIEVKNYDINKYTSNLVRNVVKQAKQRDIHLPPGMEQQAWIDVRGQKYTESQLNEIASKIERRTGGLIKQDDVRFIKE